MDEVALGDQMEALADDVRRLRINLLSLPLDEAARRVSILAERALDLRETVDE